MKIRKFLAILCVLALVCSMAVAVSADNSVVTVYTGSTANAGWADVFEIYTTNWGGTLDAGFITEGGYMSVYFTGTNVWQIRLCLNGSKWTEIDWHVDEASRTGGTITDLGNDSYVVVFTYSEIVEKYGTDDFAGTLGAVYVSTNGQDPITVTSVTWTNVSGEEETEGTEGTEETEETEGSQEAPTADGTVIYSGSAASEMWGWPVEINTTNYGGTFDPAVLTEGSYISVCYTGTSGQVRLAMKDGDWGWHQIDVPDSTVASGDGYVSVFSYDAIVAAYGSSDLSDMLQLLTGAGNAEDVVIVSVNVTAGTAEEPEEPTETTAPEEESSEATTAPTEAPTTAPTEAPTTAPTEGTTEAPTTEAPTEEVTESAPQTGGTVVYEGSAVIGGEWTMGPQIFTTPFNGPLDPAILTEGGSFSVYYTGTPDAIYFAMQDGTNWGWYQLDTPDSTVQAGDGYVSTYSYASLMRVYSGSDLSDLGSVIVGSGAASDIVFTKIVWNAASASSGTEATQATTEQTNGNAETGDGFMLIPAVASMVLSMAGVVALVPKKRSV